MRLAADAAHQFGGIELDRRRPLSFRIDGRTVSGFAGDTVLSALLAAGIDTAGSFAATALGLSPRFAPLIVARGGAPLPMERSPATDGADFSTVGTRRGLAMSHPRSLCHVLDDVVDPPWLRAKPDETRSVDLLVVGGGVAGLAAADAAASAGKTVLLAERRPWLGGDARFFGAVGDDESPETLTTRLARQLSERANASILIRAEVFELSGELALLHVVEMDGSAPRGRVIAVSAKRVLLATGTVQRLPIFPGNRQPTVATAIDAYHLAKRYGITRGNTALVATQSNYGYRLALRLHDAGVRIGRIVDTRIHPQSRFVDFAKASGLTLASGQFPLSATNTHFVFAPTSGAGASVGFDADQLIVSGGWQPDLALWMQTGGAVRWSAERSALLAHGQLDHAVLAGSVAGYRSLRGCAESGRAAAATVFGESADTVEDTETGTHLETPDTATPIAPAASDVPAFLDAGRSLAARPIPGAAKVSSGHRIHVLTLADVAASVELGLIASTDAGGIAEERGAPGNDLQTSNWAPPTSADVVDMPPPYLAHRFGDEPQRLHLIVDAKRRFPVGTLVYSNDAERDPEHAIGVIVAAAPIGGIALVAKAGCRLDRFIVDTADGPSPARIKRS